MPYAVLEKEIEKLDETQQNTVVLFVRFLLSQQSSACLTKTRIGECEGSARVEALYGSLRLPPELEGKSDDELKDGYFREKYGAFA